MTEQTWAVLGGGMLGLTLALELAEKGKKVTLVEAADTPGGLVTPWRLDEVTWDRFYHVIVSSDQDLLRLLDVLGLGSKVEWGQTRTLFFAGSDLFPLNNVFDYLRLPTLSMLDKMRLGFNIVYGASVKDGRRFESMPASQWLTRISGRNAYEKLWRPLLRAKLGSNEPQASAAFIWSVMRRFYGAREGKSKVEQFGYVKGGYQTVITAFTQYLQERGVELVCHSPVENVSPMPNGQINVRYAGESRVFDRAAMTFAAPIAARVCNELSDHENQQLKSILYQGVVCVSMLLKRGLGGAYLTYITDESLPFTTIIEMSSLVDRSELGGNHLIYLPKYVPSTDPFLKLSDDEVLEMFIDGVKKMYPDFSADDIVAIHVARTPYVAPVMTCNFTKNIPAVKSSVPNLYIVSSAQLVHGSSSVEETIRLVHRAMPEMLEDNV